jgi:membrane-bound ClpP family serine protease
MANINKPDRFFQESMEGMNGRAVGELNPEGAVIIKGELWQSVAAGPPIYSGELITVIAQDGLTLTVERRAISDGKGKR